MLISTRLDGRSHSRLQRSKAPRLRTIFQVSECNIQSLSLVPDDFRFGHVLVCVRVSECPDPLKRRSFNRKLQKIWVYILEMLNKYKPMTQTAGIQVQSVVLVSDDSDFGRALARVRASERRVVVVGEKPGLVKSADVLYHWWDVHEGLANRADYRCVPFRYKIPIYFAYISWPFLFHVGEMFAYLFLLLILSCFALTTRVICIFPAQLPSFPSLKRLASRTGYRCMAFWLTYFSSFVFVVEPLPKSFAFRLCPSVNETSEKNGGPATGPIISGCSFCLLLSAMKGFCEMLMTSPHATRSQCHKRPEMLTEKRPDPRVGRFQMKTTLHTV